MILVTGAAGKTGQAVVQALSARSASVRAFVRRAEQTEALMELGAAEVLAGDLRNRDLLHAAARDISAIYHICPNMRPDELSIAQLVMRAVQVQGCHRFVYHSVLHPQTEEMPHHWQKLRVEELLLRSGMEFTILQPASYMQNLLAYWPAIVEEGLYRVPYALGTRLGMVDLVDVAEAAARVLTEDGHVGATYELAGAEIFNQAEIAAAISHALGRYVEVRSQSREEWAKQARAARLDGYAIDVLLRMFRYYETFGFCGNPTILTHLLGREPVSLAQFLLRLTS